VLVIASCIAILVGEQFPNNRFGALTARLHRYGTDQKLGDRVGTGLGVVFLLLILAGLTVGAARDIIKHGWESEAVL
jgi:hypothetical protein